MQPLSLNEERKSKLLEICEKLFSKYEFIINHQDLINQVYINNKHGCGFLNWPYSINEIWIVHKKQDQFEVIHWFEFCWIILNKLSSKMTPMQTKHHIEMLGIICFNKSSLQHPVDYLYDEFKKLKIK